MKNILQPKYIAILVFVIAGFFIVRNEFKGANDIAPAAPQKQELCPVHNVHLLLDTVKIAIETDVYDSIFAANRVKYFPLAQDTFYLLEWYKDDEHKNMTRSEVWFCPACREAKKKYLMGQVM
jgi:hypothetical protein